MNQQMDQLFGACLRRLPPSHSSKASIWPSSMPTAASSAVPPAEADMQRHFRVTPPTVHQMVLNLDRAGLITRRPGVARTIELLIDPGSLPVLR